MRWTVSLGAAMAMMLSASPAHAEWHEAKTNHFVLTIDDTAANARAFAERLERFDAALRRLYGVSDDPDQHNRPIQIFAFKEKLFYETCGCILQLGYYQRRIQNSVIFSRHMPEIDQKTKDGWWSSQTLILHEYAHHFANNNFPIAYPYWFSEGFAEFNATARFQPDGGVLIGYPANYRAAAIKSGGHLSPRQLFVPERYSFGGNIDLLYGRGWLLTHYLMLKKERAGELGAYLDATNKGMDSLAAAERVFGDLKKLNAELDAYAKGALAPSLRVAPAGTTIDVTVRALTLGEAAMLPVYARVISGIQKGQRSSVASKAAKIASRFPADPVVQEQWAEAEMAAEHLDRADEAADAAIRLDPNRVGSLVVKGLVAEARLEETHSIDPASWNTSRGWFVRANRTNSNAALPLYHYYASFIRSKQAPTRASIKGLRRAQVLAPESSEPRVMLARQLLLDGDVAGTRSLLQPLAFSPHAKSDKNLLKQIIDLIDAGKIVEAKRLIEPMGKADEKSD